LEAGRKFSFEIDKHETRELFAVSVEYLRFPIFLVVPTASKIGRVYKVLSPQP